MHDVIIVGARCAGSAIAMLLARRGYRVLLIDRDTFPSTRCEFDLAAMALSGSPPAVDGEAAGFAPRRFLLDEILFRAAVCSGAEVREGCRVEHLLTDDGRVVGVSGVTPSGRAFSERARLVVGADGASSRVAAEVRAPKYDTKPALQGTAWIYWKDVPLEAFELHPRLAERTSRAERADEKIYLGLTQSFFCKGCGPGWVLVGDAHYTKDPCTAQGTTDTFCDAEALAEVIDQGLRGDRDLSQALEEYEVARVARAMPFYELTCEMATFAPPQPEMAALYSALQGNLEATEAFVGAISEAFSPAELFHPDNIERILTGGVARRRQQS